MYSKLMYWNLLKMTQLLLLGYMFLGHCLYRKVYSSSIQQGEGRKMGSFNILQLGRSLVWEILNYILFGVNNSGKPCCVVPIHSECYHHPKLYPQSWTFYSDNSTNWWTWKYLNYTTIMLYWHILKINVENLNKWNGPCLCSLNF
jgi:hypothetical protein